MFNQEDIQVWEDAIDEAKRFAQFTPKRKPHDPRKEKLRNYRRSEKWGSPRNGHETALARRLVQRKFRMKMKNRQARGNDALHPVPHDYKTYGWETW